MRPTSASRTFFIPGYLPISILTLLSTAYPLVEVLLTITTYALHEPEGWFAQHLQNIHLLWKHWFPQYQTQFHYSFNSLLLHCLWPSPPCNEIICLSSEDSIRSYEPSDCTCPITHAHQLCPSPDIPASAEHFTYVDEASQSHQVLYTLSPPCALVVAILMYQTGQ